MRFAASEYGQETWRHQSAADIDVDLHWNLINHPSLRRGALIDFDNLEWETAGPPAARRIRATPATRLAIAAVHAAFGHQFEHLLMLCDIREAVRQVLDAADVAKLGEIWRGPACAAVDIALGTTARRLNDSCSAELRNRLGSRATMLGGSRLISETMLLCSGGRGHWVRRRLLRGLLKRAA